MCTKNTTPVEVLRDKLMQHEIKYRVHNTLLRLVLHLSLNTSPNGVFSVHSHSSDIIIVLCVGRSKGQSVLYFPYSSKGAMYYVKALPRVLYMI